jgi:hypothetical protein
MKEWKKKQRKTNKPEKDLFLLEKSTKKKWT